MDIYKGYDFPKKIQNLKIFKTRSQPLFWQFFVKNETKKLFLDFLERAENSAFENGVAFISRKF